MIRGARRLDGEEIKRLVDKFAPGVYRLAYARTGNRADAEDVMQEVFLRLVRAGPDFHDDEHAKAWLLRVTANCAGDLFRAPWRGRVQSLDEAGELTQPDPEPGGTLEAVLALPPKYRAPVHLYYYEGYSVAEIAGILGKSESAVKTRLSRARAMLRKDLVGGEEHV